MEISESKANSTEQQKNTEDIKETGIINLNEAKEILERDKNSDRGKENMLENSSLINEDLDISNVSKSICKIKTETSLGTKYGTGFLLRFKVDHEIFYCLTSNGRAISNNMINNQDNIYISYDSEFKSTNIKLDKKKRYIKNFTDE